MNFQREYEAYLEHYGVKGMRWGVKKEKYKTLNRSQQKMLKTHAFNLRRLEKYKQLSTEGRLNDKQKEKRKLIEKNQKAIKKALKIKIDDASAKIEADDYKKLQVATIIGAAAGLVVSKYISTRINDAFTMNEIKRSFGY